MHWYECGHLYCSDLFVPNLPYCDFSVNSVRGKRGGLVVELQTPNCQVLGWIPWGAMLCASARPCLNDKKNGILNSNQNWYMYFETRTHQCSHWGLHYQPEHHGAFNNSAFQHMFTVVDIYTVVNINIGVTSQM